jgi:hypothetical protein
MTVTEVRLHSTGASSSASATDAGAVQVKYRTSHRVICSDPLDSPDAVLLYFRGNTDLPWFGRPYKFANGFNALSTCRTIDATFEEKSGGWWNVVSTYEPLTTTSGATAEDVDGNATQNPLLWHDDIDVSTTQISIPVEQAIFQGFQPGGITNRFLTPGKKTAVVNSAMVPFDPTLEEEIDITVIRITKYVAKYYGPLYNKYKNAVNSDNVVINKPTYNFFDGFGQYQGKVKQFSATFAIENRIRYYKQTLEVHVNPLPLGWRRVVLDKGLDRRQAAQDPDGLGGTISNSDVSFTAAPQHKPIEGLNGMPLSEPVNLDGNGQPLATGKDNVYLIYSTKNEIPFSGIQW